MLQVLIKKRHVLVSIYKNEVMDAKFSIFIKKKSVQKILINYQYYHKVHL